LINNSIYFVPYNGQFGREQPRAAAACQTGDTCIACLSLFFFKDKVEAGLLRVAAVFEPSGLPLDEPSIKLAPHDAESVLAVRWRPT
jgi:hypothetical protein